MKKTEIFDISYMGSGVGKIDGKVVFVPKTLPKETVEVDIISSGSKFQKGKLVKIISPNEKRIKPLCPYFENCGACDFQHTDAEFERQLKIKILQKELKKVGFFEKINFVESDKRYFYRNKIKLDFENGKLGYHSIENTFLPVEKCVIASQKINDALKNVQEFLKMTIIKNLKCVYFKEVKNDVAICFLFDKNSKKVAKNAVNLQILTDFSIFFAYGEILESDETEIFCVQGQEKLEKEFMGVETKSDIRAFNQVNDFVAEKLYKKVLTLAKGKRVVNAYSGQGFLTYLISKVAKFVYGIEIQPSAHDAAERLEKLEERYCMKNICGKVEEELPKIIFYDEIDLVVLDPSREGCKSLVMEKLNESNIDEIAYISCEFSTLVRDLKILTKIYKIQNITIFNMFPCTANMETLAILRKI